MDYGFLRVAAVAPKVNVADCEQNVKNIIFQNLSKSIII